MFRWLFKKEREAYENEINSLKDFIELDRKSYRDNIELQKKMFQDRIDRLEDRIKQSKIKISKVVDAKPVRNISAEEVYHTLNELHPNDMYLYFQDGELTTYNQGRIVGRLEIIDQIEALLYEDDIIDEDEEDGTEQY